MDTHQKALQVNLDPGTYGTLAEIGAGQEVARWLFRVGGAAGTIAKAMSAYDMTFSDAIYGPCERYVSRERLVKMLDHEFALLVERLGSKRGPASRFFVFADTVATRSYSRQEDGHGWLGVRFQTAPLAVPTEVTIHVRLTDLEMDQQQEALGIVGVNLVHAALFGDGNIDALIPSLIDSLTTDRVEVDMIELSGPGFAHVDNRLASLKLVEHGLTNAALFTAAGKVVQPSDVLYKKHILVERGSFRPATSVTVDMLRGAEAQFRQEADVTGEPVVVLFEMTLKNLRTNGDAIDAQDFLDRADILATLGHTVLISNFGEYHRLAAYLFRYTKKRIGLVMGVSQRTHHRKDQRREHGGFNQRASQHVLQRAPNNNAKTQDLLLEYCIGNDWRHEEDDVLRPVARHSKCEKDHGEPIQRHPNADGAKQPPKPKSRLAALKCAEPPDDQGNHTGYDPPVRHRQRPKAEDALVERQRTSRQAQW